MKDFDTREKGGFKKHMLKDASDLDLGQDPRLKLMPFQVCPSTCPEQLSLKYTGGRFQLALQQLVESSALYPCR